MPQRRDALFRHFPALRHADYRALWFASAASAVSLWAMIMARAWLALELSGSGFWVGVVTFAALAPWALSPLGGALADRFDRARVVMLSRTITASLALGLALLVFTDVITVWQIALFAGAAGLARAVETPAQQALLPNTIDSSALLNAIALVSLTQFGSRLIGPLAGLPLLTGVGPGWVFVMSAGFLLLSISQLARLRVRSSGGLHGSQRSILREMQANVREGLRYVGQHRPVRLVIGLVALHCMLTMSFDALLPILATRELGGGAGLFGSLVMGVGGGALVGTLALSVVGNPRTRGTLFLLSSVLSGLSALWLGLADSAAMAVAAAAAIGASQGVFMSLSSMFIQMVVPDAVRGRVMSTYAMSAGGLMAVMVLINGTAADFISVGVLLVVPAIAYVVLLLAWSLAGRELRNIYRLGALPAPAEGVAGVPAAGGAA